MPSFQSPEPMSGRPCVAESETPHDGSDAVLVQTGRFFRPAGQIVIRVLLRVYRAAFDEVDGFVQHPGVPGVQNVAARRQRQPQIIIRTVRAHAPARGGMPPMLDISLRELTGRAAEQVLAHEAWLCVDERHHVLQLVAETEGAPRLVVSAPCPKTARERLVEEPPVGQHVEGLVGRFHIDCAESVVPILPHRFERAARGSRSPKAMHQVPGVIGVSAPRRA